jgi:hypothetical protein
MHRYGACGGHRMRELHAVPHSPEPDPPRGRSLIVAATALAGVVATAVGVAMAGGESQPVEAPPGLLARCDAPQDDFDVGQEAAGLALAHRTSLCTDPQPVRSEAAGGDIDPQSYARSHYTLAVYGTCAATSETGCAPPLQIQTWPACERSPADYTVGGQPLQPTDVVRVRGVPARFYGENRLEISTGDSTVVIFGDSRELLLSAAAALRTRAGSPRSVGPGSQLPAPAAGAEDGTLSC